MPVFQGVSIFPASNIWNARADSLPVDPNSDAIIARISEVYQAANGGNTPHLKVDDMIPWNVVDDSVTFVPLGGISTPESDPGLWPIPNSPLIEAGDGHCLILHRTRSMLFEIFFLQGGPGSWTGGSAAKWDLNSEALRPNGWTSSDAAGLPVLPGIVKYEDILAGSIQHCMRITVSPTMYAQYVWPARHYASHDTTANNPQMGMRIRLKASFDVSGFSPVNQIILRGLQQYGAMVADNGLPYSMEHDQDSRWDTNDLLALHNVPDTAFEFVLTSGLMQDPDLGLAVAIPPALLMTDQCSRSTPVPYGYHLGLVNGVFQEVGPVQYVNQVCTPEPDRTWLTTKPGGRNFQVWKNGALLVPNVDYVMGANPPRVIPLPAGTQWPPTSEVLAAFLY